MKNRKEAIRKKLLGLFKRSTLEDLAQGAQPWLCDRNELIARALANWNQDEVEYEVKKLLGDAR